LKNPKNRPKKNQRAGVNKEKGKHSARQQGRKIQTQKVQKDPPGDSFEEEQAKKKARPLP